MKVIIIGCGRMGRGLGRLLCKKGDEVTIIDQRPEAFKELGSHYTGETIVGYGVDKETLEKAGIARADALISCTNNDEVNALVARAARINYSVPRVIARLYDPHKASIYNALGIQVLSSTNWAIRHAAELLSYNHFNIIEEFGSGQVKIVQIDLPSLMAGRSVAGLNRMGQCAVSSIRRGNDVFMPTDGFILEAGDVLFITVQAEFLPTLKSILGMR